MQPPESLKSLSDPIYESFYGLKEQPFAISTDPKFLFLSAPHRRAYDELINGIMRDETLLLLTGETGSGKTTLCRAVIGALGDRTFSSILHQPYMTGPEMLRLILRDFGLVSREELRRGVLAAADVPQLMDVLEGFLRSLVSIQSRAIVVIDEAQSLSPTLLDEVRMLTAFEKDGRRLVQIVLCGQPMLLNTLKTEPMYALNERITRRVVLTPLSPEEVDAYIHHRLMIAGGEDAVAFQPDAVKLIADLSRGLPRRVNVLADRTLQEGRVESARIIGATLVKRAARSLAGAHSLPSDAEANEDQEQMARELAGLSLTIGGERSRWRVPRAIGLIVAAMSLAGGLFYWYYAGQLLTGNAEMSAPGRPAKDIGRPPAKIAMPTDEELNAFFQPLRWIGGGGGLELDQLPDDRHQLD